MGRAGFVAAVAALIIAIVYMEFRISSLPGPAGEPVLPPDTSALEARLDRIEDLLARIPFAPIPDGPDLPDTAGAESAPDIDNAASPSDIAPQAIPEQIQKVKEFLARLEEGNVGGEEMSQLWTILPGSGLHNEALAALVKHAKAHPNDADAQYGVGIGTISKLVGGQVTYVEQGTLSMMADEAFDRALKIDDHHFNARFSKAISYTHWPPTFGKGPAAISEFEILRQQSAQDPNKPELEGVYTNLGIQYRLAGNQAKSREALEEGLRVFPDSKDLREQLKVLGD
jgi:hypothetical protein